MDRQRILIVDDSMVNREILINIFSQEADDYELLEAQNGEVAIQQIESHHDIVLILLDIMMPVMNGFEFLEYMQEHDLLKEVPVILITGESAETSEGKAYSFGVADVIHKPFDRNVVRRRSKNIIELYQSKRNMEIRLKQQEEEIRAQEKEIRETNEFMIDALSSVVESRNAETGDHTKRIKFYTKNLATHLMRNFSAYKLTAAQVDAIARASVLHDIGKIGISDTILLKPGKLTNEEFEIMKTHTVIGCELLEKIYRDQATEFYQHCYDICRHHHERWDGRGYPDHLAGNDIPISAQIVSVADVYDALVSPRVYKNSFTNEKAFEMIMNGECGQFGPDVLKSFELAKKDFVRIHESFL